jgi:hypothetical protein
LQIRLGPAIRFVLWKEILPIPTQPSAARTFGSAKMAGFGPIPLKGNPMLAGRYDD